MVVVVQYKSCKSALHFFSLFVHVWVCMQILCVCLFNKLNRGNRVIVGKTVNDIGIIQLKTRLARLNVWFHKSLAKYWHTNSFD